MEISPALEEEEEKEEINPAQTPPIPSYSPQTPSSPIYSPCDPTSPSSCRVLELRMAHQVLPRVPLPTDDWECEHGGDCLGHSDDCGPCTDERCVSAQALEDGWSDANHCGNGCPYV